MYASWGYDQTNIDFYKILSIDGHRVKLVELSHITVPGSEGNMSDKVMPGGPLENTVIVRQVRSEVIKVNSSVWLRQWDGQPKFRSWYA